MEQLVVQYHAILIHSIYLCYMLVSFDTKLARVNRVTVGKILVTPFVSVMVAQKRENIDETSC